jgi:hypothetical protein
MRGIFLKSGSRGGCVTREEVVGGVTRGDQETRTPRFRGITNRGVRANVILSALPIYIYAAVAPSRARRALRNSRSGPFERARIQLAAL